MGLSDLRNPESVHEAVRQFDELGRNRFLRRYGFGKAREYFLDIDGQLYDSKAIVGAAHGFEYPSAGPLRSSDFSGGEATVQEKLESLGFRVRRIVRTPVVRDLTLYGAYSREEVHDIFEPETPFTPHTGRWGLPGIVALHTPANDFVFFVSLGKKEAGEVYQDALSRTGILDWDSQRKQNQRSSEIIKLINHDEAKNRVHLFLRSRDEGPYTYFGPLKYLWHDPATNHPVHFRFQVLHWDTAVAERIGVVLLEDMLTPPQRLTQVAPPVRRQQRSRREKKVPFEGERARLGTDYAEREAANRALGYDGEMLVVEFERESLRKAGRVDLARRVQHIPTTMGDGLGYDVLSFTPDERPKYIEVKTTRGGHATPFFITAHEVAASIELAENYLLYRVFEYSDREKSGKVFTIQPPIADTVVLKPAVYKASFIE